MKKILLTIFALVLLIPLVPTHAGYDQRCWLEKDFGNQLGCVDFKPPGVFYSTEETTKVCGGEEYFKGKKIGFCQAVGDATTAVSFGGRTQFANIGEFIQFMYRYGVAIAGILAVLMIIVAGVQWILSGGNAERITSARKRISGAIVGLVLAILSYGILNTVNPYLVNLRMPQIWMINQTELAPPACDDVDSGSFALAAKPGETVNKDNFKPANLKNMETECGHQYFVGGTAGQTCTGNSCAKDKHICVQNVCTEATLRGILKNSNIMTNVSGQIQNNSGPVSGLADLLIGIGAEGFEYPWAEDQEFYVICKNGDYDRIEHSGKNEPDNDATQKNDAKLTQKHWILVPDKSVDEGTDYCKSKGGTRGFAYSLDFNEEGEAWDERHLIGRTVNKVPVDLGRKQSEMEKNVFSKDCINQYLFTAEEVKNGVSYSFDIDVDRVCDIDTGSEGEEERVICYGNSAALRNYADLGYEKTKDECKSTP